MLTLLRREFVVNVTSEVAWRHLAQVEQWPKWAGHIKRIFVNPSGNLGPGSVGIIHLSNGNKAIPRLTAEMNALEE